MSREARSLGGKNGSRVDKQRAGRLGAKAKAAKAAAAKAAAELAGRSCSGLREAAEVCKSNTSFFGSLTPKGISPGRA
jgi:hypothetical protein